jgi:hypothetical protein
MRAEGYSRRRWSSSAAPKNPLASNRSDPDSVSGERPDVTTPITLVTLGSRPGTADNETAPPIAARSATNLSMADPLRRGAAAADPRRGVRGSRRTHETRAVSWLAFIDMSAITRRSELRASVTSRSPRMDVKMSRAILAEARRLPRSFALYHAAGIEWRRRERSLTLRCQQTISFVLSFNSDLIWRLRAD